MLVTESGMENSVIFTQFAKAELPMERVPSARTRVSRFSQPLRTVLGTSRILGGNVNSVSAVKAKAAVPSVSRLGDRVMFLRFEQLKNALLPI